MNGRSQTGFNSADLLAGIHRGKSGIASSHAINCINAHSRQIFYSVICESTFVSFAKVSNWANWAVCPVGVLKISFGGLQTLDYRYFFIVAIHLRCRFPKPRRVHKVCDDFNCDLETRVIRPSPWNSTSMNYIACCQYMT